MIKRLLSNLNIILTKKSLVDLLRLLNIGRDKKL
jgi:hypothetical protein